MFILFFGMLLAPGGLLYGPVESLAHAIVGADAAQATVEVFSSRVVFLTLFIVAFVAWTLQRQLEESAEFTAQKDADKSSIVDNIKLLFTNKIAVKTVAYLAAIYLTWNLVASVMGFFMPHVYETAGGLTNETANMLSCISWVFVVVTTLIISFFVDKVAHRFFYVFGLAAALTAWILVIGGSITSIAGIWVFTILWGVNNGSSVQVFYALWGSELFPAKFRAGAQGLMFFIVRGLSAVWGLVFTFIYGENGEGFTLAAYCMVGLLLISLIVGLIGMPNTRGKSLEQITRERYGENY
jgi:inositol transporter-like SP family MFS transporter